jgi:predicted transcriptional regulator
MNGKRRAPRPQPIRDKIMVFLSEPRSACDVAELIERSVPIATGHLAAMRRAGLVKRIGYSAYALSDYDGPAVDLCRRQSMGEPALRRRLRTLLHEPSTVLGLRCRTGAPEIAVRAALHDLWMSGLVRGNDETGYRLARAGVD